MPHKLCIWDNSIFLDRVSSWIFSENGTLKKQLNDERSKMQSKILTLEEENEKLTKENKNKKLASQQNKVKFHFRRTSGQYII